MCVVVVVVVGVWGGPGLLFVSGRRELTNDQPFELDRSKFALFAADVEWQGTYVYVSSVSLPERWICWQSPGDSFGSVRDIHAES